MTYKPIYIRISGGVLTFPVGILYTQGPWYNTWKLPPSTPEWALFKVEQK